MLHGGFIGISDDYSFPAGKLSHFVDRLPATHR